MKIFNLLFILFAGLSIASCGSSGNSGCSDIEMDQKETAMTTALSLLYDAQIAYSTDDSPANCTAVINAWDDYLKKLRSFIDCLEGPAKDTWESNYAIQVQMRNDFSC